MARNAIDQAYESCKHITKLQLGVIASHRRQGIDEGPIRAVIEDAFSKCVERIELEVFATNTGAISLYEKIGFLHEGRMRDARRINGSSHDNLMMALLR